MERKIKLELEYLIFEEEWESAGLNVIEEDVNKLCQSGDTVGRMFHKVEPSTGHMEIKGVRFEYEDGTVKRFKLKGQAYEKN